MTKDELIAKQQLQIEEKPMNVIRLVCPKCNGNGWYFVNEWIGTLQGRRDCSCKGQPSQETRYLDL